MTRRKQASKKSAKAKSRAAKAKSMAKTSAKTASKRVVKLVKKAANGNGLPRPSSKAWGQAGRALDGVRILDFTHVQSGPTCTQLLAYLGADVIKVERPGVGDITRGQLRDVKGADSLYFTMLNGSKRSITIDSKHPKGREILDRLVRQCDVLVENFAPGALDRMGLTWEHIHKLNPRMIVASVKGFGPGPYEDCKVYENVAQCAGFDDRLPRRSAARHRRADRRFRYRPASRARNRLGALSACTHRPRPARARRHAGRRPQSVPRQVARPAAAQ
jgi:formyl-CoA transferase